MHYDPANIGIIFLKLHIILSFVDIFFVYLWFGWWVFVVKYLKVRLLSVYFI